MSQTSRRNKTGLCTLTFLQVSLLLSCQCIDSFSISTSTVSRQPPSLTSIGYSDSNSVDVPFRSSFEDRMRKMALQEQSKVLNTNPNKTIKVKRREGTRENNNINPRKPNHVHEISTLHQLQNVLYENTMNTNQMGDSLIATRKETQQPTVSAVRWYAPWCRACRAVEPIFYNMSRKLQKDTTVPLSTPTLQFVDIPCTKENYCLQIGFNVPKVPYGHIYHSDYGLVEELSFTTSTATHFSDILQSYVQSFCPLPDSIDPITNVYESPYVRLA